MAYRLLIGGLMAMTMGCQTVPPGDDEVPRVVGEGNCDAGRAQYLIGRQATAELGGEARARSGAEQVRWIRPGDAVTMDYRTDRLNIHLDAQGRITRIDCG